MKINFHSLLSAVAFALLTPAPLAQAGGYERANTLSPSPKRATVEAQSRAAALPTENTIPWLRELGARYDTLPGTTEMITTTRGGHDIRVALHERGHATNDSLVIMLHGVLADHSTWRYLAAELGDANQLWLIDLPGCGESEKPKPSKIETDGYSPTGLGERVLQVLDHKFRQIDAEGKSPRRVILLAHSLGGMIAVRAFSDPELRERYANALTRIDQLVLMAPADVAVHAEIPVFMQIVNLKNWQAVIARNLGALRTATTASTRNGFSNPECALRERARELELILRETKEILRCKIYERREPVIPYVGEQGKIV